MTGFDQIAFVLLRGFHLWAAALDVYVFCEGDYDGVGNGLYRHLHCVADSRSNEGLDAIVVSKGESEEERRRGSDKSRLARGRSDGIELLKASGSGIGSRHVWPDAGRRSDRPTPTDCWY